VSSSLHVQDVILIPRSKWKFCCAHDEASKQNKQNPNGLGVSGSAAKQREGEGGKPVPARSHTSCAGSFTKFLESKGAGGLNHSTGHGTILYNYAIVIIV
jgi:hypothetical protein